MKNCFLSVPTLKKLSGVDYSMTQSSYSIKCSRQGVVSKTGGIDTGELINPKNDIFNIIITITLLIMKIN